ncbi:hypothetical protein C9374_007335 [Naegleria lovaniensis]|uniref:UDENN domain-containing protein n=1 Tax=Naegleria lovaniensis TaxID=51637 RepID=A0AA88KIG4_NAELO|nr:uncharacterized protein C9374_007335 [Naegleria lovaniensis]KAG2379196.1 hypothetical protein C9374_007335 [Naegleria lovaniensis]
MSAISSSTSANAASLTSQMRAICILEKDTNLDTLNVWSFPILSDDQKTIIMNRSPLNSNSTVLSKQYSDLSLDNSLFVCSKFDDCYVYSLSRKVKLINSNVTDVNLVILSTEYWMKKYEKYLEVMMNVLIENQLSPLPLLEVYLRLFSKGTYKDQITADLFSDPRAAKVGNLSMLIKSFGEESVRIWSALMLKKRIVIYHDNIFELLEVMSAIPSLVLHRQQADFIRPLINFDSPIETKDLTQSNFYCAGTLDRNMRNNSKFYDLFVDATTKRTSVNESQIDEFKLTKIHKDLLKVVTGEEIASMENTHVIKQVSQKTKELLQKLLTVKEQNDNQLTLDIIKGLQLQPDLEKFLYGVAVSECMITSL